MATERQENPMMINRRNFTIIGGAALLAYLTNGCIGKDTAVKGTEALYQQGQTPAPVGTPAFEADPYIEKRILGGYTIKGKKSVEGVAHIEKIYKPSEHMRLPDNVLETGNDDDIEVTFDDEGKLRIYANKASFDISGAIIIDPDLKGAKKIPLPFNYFKEVEDGAFRYIMDVVEELENKHNIPAGTAVQILPLDSRNNAQYLKSIERGGFAVARIVLN